MTKAVVGLKGMEKLEFKTDPISTHHCQQVEFLAIYYLPCQTKSDPSSSLYNIMSNKDPRVLYSKLSYRKNRYKDRFVLQVQINLIQANLLRPTHMFHRYFGRRNKDVTTMHPPSDLDIPLDDTTMTSNDSSEIDSEVHVFHLPPTSNISTFDITFR